MSKFYTYQELKDRLPTKDAVTQARDMVSGYISERGFDGLVVIYGSAAWGLHKKFGDQHTRRSDVDVASSPSYGAGMRFYLDNDFYDFCAKVEGEMGVSVEITEAGHMQHYTSLINPSTADHFRLLASKFPRAAYKEFLSTMDVNFQSRIEDLHGYTQDIRDKHTDVEYKQDGELFYDSINLKTLSILENFPDHLIRKVLGREKMLPCPDSKENIRRVLEKFPYSWKFKEKLSPLFKEILTASVEYEALIDDVGSGISETAYKEKLLKLAGVIVDASGEILKSIPWDLESFLRIARIGKGTPVIILDHYGEDRGSVQSVKLDSDFGNPKEGVCYFLGREKKAVYGIEEGEPLVKEWITTDTHVYMHDRNLRWIKDPIDPEKGWFTYKSAEGGVYSIKPCSEELMATIIRETDWNSVKPGVRNMKQREYYARFCKEALNPEFSHVPVIRKRK
jgi:hypothetical protein